MPGSLYIVDCCYYWTLTNIDCQCCSSSYRLMLRVSHCLLIGRDVAKFLHFHGSKMDVAVAFTLACNNYVHTRCNSQVHRCQRIDNRSFHRHLGGSTSVKYQKFHLVVVEVGRVRLFICDSCSQGTIVILRWPQEYLSGFVTHSRNSQNTRCPSFRSLTSFSDDRFYHLIFSEASRYSLRVNDNVFIGDAIPAN